MDVKFRNPFYHNQLGLLGGAGDEGTTYVLDDDEVIPRTADVVDGVSLDRKKNDERGSAATKAARVQADKDEASDDEPHDEGPAKRVKPKEGKAKSDNIVKKRKG